MRSYTRTMGKICVILILALLANGCAHTFTRQKVAMSLAKGKTTKEEVLATFGIPEKKYLTPGMKIVSGGKELVLHNPIEVWIYSPHQLKLFDLLEPEPLRIVFTQDNIVSNYYYLSEDD